MAASRHGVAFVLAVAAAAPACAAQPHPVTGTWHMFIESPVRCEMNYEFRADGSMTESDGDHRSLYRSAPFGPIDRLGFVRWKATVVEDNGKAGCTQGPPPAVGKTFDTWLRPMRRGVDLAICSEERADTCSFSIRRTDTSPSPPRVPELEFEDDLEWAIHRALPTPDLTLMPADRGPVAFATADKPAVVDCERRGAWKLVRAGVTLGAIFGSRCADGARVAGLVDGVFADARLKSMLAEVAKNARPVGGLATSRETLADGSTLSYFPVLLVGHGIVPVWSATLVDKSRKTALAVQADTAGCPEKGPVASLAFCADPQAVLTRVAKALAATKSGL